MLELVKLDSATLPAIANAIREKTGDTALLLPSQMAAAIAGITGATLPEMTAPATDVDVLSGKEYIGKAGDKHTGTLVVCDTLSEVERFGENGIGLHLELESSADGSTTAIKLHEPNLMTDNIVVGTSIFGVPGSAKTLRVETGTITPAEDTASLALPCTASPKMFVLSATDAAMNSITADNVAAMVSAAGYGNTVPTGTDGSYNDSVVAACTMHLDSRKISTGGIICVVSPTVKIGVFSVYRWKAGLEYQWTAYYWED